MPATSTDGLLLVDKPTGISSHDVVALARRALGTRRIGHAGTLDPFATGLLVLLSGAGTRLMQFLPGEPKVYDATIRFGTETDTDDCTGVVTRTGPLPDPAAVRAALPALTGALQQEPPAYSAKHVNGTRAYALARRGVTPALAPRPVHVTSWDVLAQATDTLRARVTCSGGTYIRALARDLGRALGSAAHLRALRRERVGLFDVRDADTPDAWRSGAPRLLPLALAVGGLPSEVLTPERVRTVRLGGRVPAREPGLRCALLDDTGTVVAVATREGDDWQPTVVLPIAEP